jgi:hypothetical protein
MTGNRQAQLYCQGACAACCTLSRLLGAAGVAIEARAT